MVANTLLMLHLHKPGLTVLTKIVAVYPYRYKIGREGWELFCQQIEVDPQYLVPEHYSGMLLKMIGDNWQAWRRNLRSSSKPAFQESDGDRD